MHKTLSISTYDPWTLLTQQSVCYCVRLNGMHKIKL
jgi:hypothetical protein